MAMGKRIFLEFFIVAFMATWMVYVRGEKRDDWYKRYPSYPEYCSTPEQMAERTIQKVKLPQGIDGYKYKTNIVHVTSVIRHGARTPWNSHQCWSGFWETPSDTSVWDCELTTLTAPPANPELVVRDASDGETIDATMDSKLAGESTMFLFDKRYDALAGPPQLRNELNGTCQMGQLLLRGYEQEITNGRILRETYVRDSSNNDSIHYNMVLFDLLNGKQKPRPYEPPNLYYRADDDQRTIMSGQVLLRGLFGDLLHEHSVELGLDDDPVIMVNTADRWRDILSANHDICPRLNDLEKDALHSQTYLDTYVKSEEANNMTNLMKVNLTNGVNFADEALDCLMTTICTDRELPTILDDYSTTDAGNFEKLMNYSLQSYNYKFIHNDGAYSKLAMGPFWSNIMQNIIPFFNSTLGTDTPPKLALFSGHDTTIMPVLATLGENVWDGLTWTPYASMFLIELHQITVKVMGKDPNTDLFPSKLAFRIIYNGKVLTSRMKGCPKYEELCDIQILLDHVMPFAKDDRNCKSAENAILRTIKEDTAIILGSWIGISLLTMTILFSFLISWFFTFVFLTRRLPNCRCSRRRVSEGTKYDSASKHLPETNSESFDRFA